MHASLLLLVVNLRRYTSKSNKAEAEKLLTIFPWSHSLLSLHFHHLSCFCIEISHYYRHMLIRFLYVKPEQCPTDTRFNSYSSFSFSFHANWTFCIQLNIYIYNLINSVSPSSFGMNLNCMMFIIIFPDP